MIDRILGLLCLLALSTFAHGAPSGAAEFDQTHAAWTRVLQEHQRGANLNYGALKRDRSGLDAYLKNLEGVRAEEFSKWKRADRYAFWINAYNAYTVRIVVDNYPVDSIKSIGKEGTIWDRAFIDLAPLFPKAKGKRLSLNDIEHQILRPEFKDARVHAAVNCASIGCPPLRKEAFTGEGLDGQLDSVVRAWLADATRNGFDSETQRAQVSQVFDWFKDDFVRDAGSVTKWLARYAPKKHQEWLLRDRAALSFLDYDWKLNDAK